MIVTFAFEVNSFCMEKNEVESDMRMEQACAEIFHDKFKGMKEYKENDIVVNFDHKTEDAPAAATVFIDMSECNNVDDVMLKFQQGFVEFLNRTVIGSAQKTPTTILPYNPHTHSVG